MLPENTYLKSNLLLSIKDMKLAENITIKSGITGSTLMENAGRGIAREISNRWQPCNVTILCGPGNNGGDGYVIARILEKLEWKVLVLSTCALSDLKGDAKIAATMWKGEIDLVDNYLKHKNPDLFVDALFGTGLSRSINSNIANVINYFNSLEVPKISVDIASGIDGDTGEKRNAAIKADLTVTFSELKKGHVLLPGKDLCGETCVIDIGIPQEVISELKVLTYMNDVFLWSKYFPIPNIYDHKYSRGHTIIIGGDRYNTGAARLSANAALRSGSGAVTILADKDSLDIYASHLTAVMIEDVSAINSFLNKDGPRSLLIGPGCRVTNSTRKYAIDLLRTGLPCILDAGALSAISLQRSLPIELMHSDCVLTPHEGEFIRLFSFTGDKLTRVQRASAESGAVVLLKGSDTVIAAPDGRVAVNVNAPPWLATAGSGDVLAGIIASLMSQGMPAFEATCASVWLHSKAASNFGIGMTAEDLDKSLLKVLGVLYKKYLDYDYKTIY